MFRKLVKSLCYKNINSLISTYIYSVNENERIFFGLEKVSNYLSYSTNYKLNQH